MSAIQYWATQWSYREEAHGKPERQPLVKQSETTFNEFGSVETPRRTCAIRSDTFGLHVRRKQLKAARRKFAPGRTVTR